MTPDYFQSSSFLLVWFVQLEYGTILKTLSTTNKSLHGCYLEELRILPEGQIGPIKSLKILHSDRSLFVGLDDRLVKIPLERCSSYPTERYDLYRPQACYQICQLYPKCMYIPKVISLCEKQVGLSHNE